MSTVCDVPRALGLLSAELPIGPCGIVEELAAGLVELVDAHLMQEAIIKDLEMVVEAYQEAAGVDVEHVPAVLLAHGCPTDCAMFGF